ncbi:hypothetical protein CDN97_22785 [Pantoea sp. AMG 501]|nr:hypothetical protein CDN97_22785 [Pantoea sp. AMG 501]
MDGCVVTCSRLTCTTPGAWPARSTASASTRIPCSRCRAASHDSRLSNGTGGGATLRGDKQTTDVILSTLGIRADSEWQISQKTTVALRSELGWQHQYGSLDRGTRLKLYNGNTPFVVNSGPTSRDGMVLKASAEVEMNKNAILSLGYGGLLSPNYQDNSINEGFTWCF